MLRLEPDTYGQLRLLVGCAPWGGQRCLSIAMVDPVLAANVPSEQGFERLAQTLQQRELREAQQQSQSQRQGNDQAFQR